ncbi:MAG: hypothetical protein JJ858_11760 [Rhizobiaceae bacterium]|nr:hypothetical protein [Rhizobiaceae bacterium]
MVDIVTCGAKRLPIGVFGVTCAAENSISRDHHNNLQYFSPLTFSNTKLNGETLRLETATRMQAK